ncbi:MAG: MFS transporter, partial [Dehalococcoidia bacterium]
GYIVVVAAFLIMTVSWGMFSSFAVFFKPLLEEFGWTRSAISGAYSLCIILSGLVAIGMGRLTDRFGPRLVIAACGLLMGLGYLLMSQIGAIWQLYLFYGVIVGIGMSAAWVPLLSPVARWFVKRRGLMTAAVVSGAGLGTMIMPPVASWLISGYGWRTAYIILGIITMVLIVLVAQFIKRAPAQMEQEPYGEGEVKVNSLNLEAEGFSLKEAIRTRQFWVLSAIWLCLGFSLGGVWVHIVIHATGIGISAASAANILAISGGISIPGGIIIGSVADRIGSRLALIIASILLLGALLWLLGAKELWMLYLFAAILGFGYGGLFVLESPLVAKLFGLSSHGVILGSVFFSYMIGDAIGPVVVGHLFDITGSYQIAFLICAAAGVIGLILTSLLKPIGSERGEHDSG